MLELEQCSVWGELYLTTEGRPFCIAYLKLIESWRFPFWLVGAGCIPGLVWVLGTVTFTPFERLSSASSSSLMYIFWLLLSWTLKDPFINVRNSFSMQLSSLWCTVLRTIIIYFMDFYFCLLMLEGSLCSAWIPTTCNMIWNFLMK